MLYDSREKRCGRSARRKKVTTIATSRADLPPLVLTPEFVAEQQSELRSCRRRNVSGSLRATR